MKKWTLISGILVLTSALFAQKNTPENQHSAWTNLLKKHVKNGVVDYRGFKKDAKNLDDYLHTLQKKPAGTATKTDMAFWINTYNAFTVRLILENYPVTSIKNINKGAPWKKSWILIGKTSYSLDDIEHKILRAHFKDPRVHFALNCASKSCPPLRNEAFEGATLGAQLDAQTADFINNPAFNHFGKTSKISPIFSWFVTDFGNVPFFIKKYYKGNDFREAAAIEYADYDWSLNGE